MSLSVRQRRFLGAFGIAVLLFTVVGFFIAPPILRSQLAKRLSVATGRVVTIEKIRLNPYALSVAIEGFAIKDRDGAPFVAWQRVAVNFDFVSFFVREWRFQEISFSAPAARIVVNKDGSFNFSDLIATFSPPVNKSAPVSRVAAGGTPTEKPPWPLRVLNLVVADAQLDFADHSRSTEFATHAGPVGFVLTNFHTNPGGGAPYEFAATTEVGEKFSWRGTLSVAPLASQGEFILGGIRLAKYAPYYRDRVRFDLLGGSLDIGGRYDVDLSGPKPRATLVNGAVHLVDFKLAPRDSQTSVIELRDLSVTGIEADWAKLAAAVANVALVGGNVVAQRAQDGAIDLVSLLAPVAPAVVAASNPQTNSVSAAAPATSTPSTAGPAPKPDVKIAEVSVRKFAASLTDHTTPRAAQHTIEDCELDAKNLSLAEGAEVPLRLSLLFPTGGTVKAEGTVVLSPMKAELDLEATSVALASVSPYLEPLLNLQIAQGTFSTKGHAHLALAANAPPELSFKGGASIDHLSTVDGVAHEEFSSWSALTVKGIDFAATPLAVAVEEIVWADPSAHLIVNPDGTNNVAAILRQAPKPAALEGGVSPAKTRLSDASVPVSLAAAPEPSAALPKITVSKIKISNAAFTLADRSIAPAVNTAINQFSGTISGISSTNLARADVDLKALVDGVGPVIITGKLDPLGAQKFVDLKLDFKNVDLTPFSSYSGKFAGYQLARGKLFLDVTAKVTGDHVDVANLVTVTQFAFGAATNSPEATKLPVRLGVALLKDLEGKMVIDIPVQGTLGDPNFRIGRVVLRVVVNLLTKAAVSPFSLVGAMFGGGGDELAYQEFAPGGVELTPENVEKLATLTKALAGRPGLNLEITGSFDSAADTFALKQQHLAKDLRAKIWEERRALDPNLPPPEQLVVTADEERALVKKLFDERFPAGAELGGPVPTAPSITAPPPKPKRTLLGRVVDVVTFKPQREESASGKTPASVAKAVTALGAAPAGASSEEMKLRLADALTISDDDLRQLATARAQRVRQYFLDAQIAAERIFLGNVAGPGTGPRVNLQLQ